MFKSRFFATKSTKIKRSVDKSFGQKCNQIWKNWKIHIFSLIKAFSSTKSISNQWQIFSLSQPSDLQQALQVHFLHLVTELKKLKLLTMQSREDFLMTDGLGNSNKEAAYDISRKICK